MLRASTGAWVASVSSFLAFGLFPLSSTSTRAQATESYPAVVHAYRNVDGEAVARLRALTVDQADEGVRSAIAGKPQPWDWKDLRAAAMLHTEAWYLARAEGARDEAARQLLQAERLLGAVTISNRSNSISRSGGARRSLCSCAETVALPRRFATHAIAGGPSRAPLREPAPFST